MLGLHQVRLDQTGPRTRRQIAVDLAGRGARATMLGVSVAAPACARVVRRAARPVARGTRLALSHREESFLALAAVAVGAALSWLL